MSILERFRKWKVKKILQFMPGYLIWRSIHDSLRSPIPIAIVLGILSLVACSEKAPTNVIIILADDLGYGDVKCYNPGQGKIATPNIDRLAGEGMLFTDAHSSSGVCSPSRYVMLTGRYHWRTRLQRGVIGLWEQPLIPADRLTIAGLAKQHGYRTAIIGKWHLGWDWPIDSAERSHFIKYGPFEGISQSEVVSMQATEEDRTAWANTFSKPIDGGPTTVGFDSYFGTDVPNWPPFCFIRNDLTVGIPSEFLEPGLVSTNQASFQGPALKGWRLDRILPTLADSAEAFIKRQAKYKTPFLLYMPLTVPHTPVAVTEAWKNKSGLGNTYADFVMEMDDVVGRVMQALEESGIAGNTMLIFTSDNGCAPYIGMKELEAQGHLPSGPLRGYKGEVWEGGHRIPFVVRLPGVVEPGSVCDKLVQHADLMATFADLFGAKLPDNAGEDSFSLMPLLRGDRETVRENAVNCRFDGLMGIRKGPWKLVCAKEPELYNLEEDIGENRNVAVDRPEVVKELMDLRNKLIADGRSTPGKQQKNDVEVRLLPEP